MSKEAVVFLLDVGPSMWQTKVDPESNVTLLDKAIKCTALMQSQKIIDGRKTDQVALILLNTPGTDNDLASGEDEDGEYSHIITAQPFDSAKYDLIKFLQEKLPLGSVRAAADPVDAIVVAADLLITLTKGKAYGSKRILFLSSFDGDDSPSEVGMDQILDQLKGNGISLDLIRLDKSTDDEEEETNMIVAFLKEKLIDPLDGQVFPIDDALGMLAEFGAKRARQVATFRGTLDLAKSLDDEADSAGLKIPISIFSKTAAGKLPSAKKLSSGEAVERSLEYRRVPSGINEEEEEDSVMPTVPKESLIKAYRYGKTLVPFTKIDEAALGYQSEKGLSVLGFVAASSIDHAAFMSPIWLVEPETGNSAATMAITALVQACFEKNSAVLARYVRAKGNSPRLVALFPKIKPAYAGFLMVALPFAEDLRRFTFPSLDKMPSVLKPSEDQKETMKLWIRSMALDSDDLKPSEISNPSNQRLVQCILARVQDPAGPIPPIEPSIIEAFTAPPRHVQETSAPFFEALKALFEIRKVEKWKHAEITRFWNVEEKPAQDAEAAAVAEKSLGEDRPEPKRIISADKPLEDFEAMVSDRHHDLVVPAFKQLMALIPTLAVAEPTLPLSIECLMALRKAAIREDEHDLYNAYLQELKRAAFTYRLSQEEAGKANDNEVSPAVLLWNALIKHPDQSSVTLISNAENPGSLVSPDHAQTFYE